MRTARWARRLGWSVVVVLGILIGVLIGRLFVPPGGPDPELHPTPATSAVATSPAPSTVP